MSLATLKSKINLLIHKASRGNIYDKIFKNEPLDLVIPDGVTSICENLYYSPSSVVSCTGADVEEITDSFFNASNIAVIDLPKLKTLGANAFEKCDSLEIFENASVQNIGTECFASCSGLTEINTPNVSEIGSNAIKITPKLTKLIVGTLTSTAISSFRQTSKNASLIELEVGKNTSADLYIHFSTNYTQKTLHKIIENLADLSSRETAGILRVGETNLAKIYDEHKAMAENKNWELS